MVGYGKDGADSEQLCPARRESKAMRSKLGRNLIVKNDRWEGVKCSENV